ncbi:hypothetical protein BRADI_2g57015v3 [Brachypodium distachyon]|uniref:Uncharacterized protein n=1 Tax=Brachypodium distachyon TaxID=15368 RepID=A0A0Q3GKG1_BRADI|nr:hypothetical protein BRADI_2g57015v3 [Brachypodium distachyon]
MAVQNSHVYRSSYKKSARMKLQYLNRTYVSSLATKSGSSTGDFFYKINQLRHTVYVAQREVAKQVKLSKPLAARFICKHSSILGTFFAERCKK